MHQPRDLALAGFFGETRGRFDVDGMEGARPALDVEADRVHDGERRRERPRNRAPVIDIRLDVRNLFRFVWEELTASLGVTGSNTNIQTVIHEVPHDMPAQEAGPAKYGDSR
jgi:hypothetical protein